MKIISMILAIVLAVTLISSITSAGEYKKYDCKYFSVEIPSDWEVREGVWDTPQYYFDDHSIPNHNRNSGPIKNLLRVSIDLDSVRFEFGEPDLLNRNYSTFNQTGYIDVNDPLIHFLQTFQIKKEALPESGTQEMESE